MSDDDVRYFQRRAEEERRRAADAKDPCARTAHQQIADAYDRIVRANNAIELRVVS
jgi:hypothetical protein